MKIKKVLSILLTVISFTLAGQTLNLSNYTVDYYINKGFDTNNNSKIEGSELDINQQYENYTFRVAYLKNYHTNTNNNLNWASDIQSDLIVLAEYLKSIDFSLSLYGMDYDVYRDLNYLQGISSNVGIEAIGIYEEYFSENEVTINIPSQYESITFIGNLEKVDELIINTNGSVEFRFYTDVKIKKLNLSNCSAGDISISADYGINTVQIDTIIFSGNPADSVNVSISNFTKHKYLNLSQSGYKTFNFNRSTFPNFICTPDGYEDRITTDNYKNKHNLYVSTDCSLSDSIQRESAISNALLTSVPSIDLNNDSLINHWEIAQADTIVVPNRDLTNIDILYLAQNLKYLDVSSNNIDTIKVEYFPNLQFLNISQNNITTIDFSNILNNNSEIQVLSNDYPLDSLIIENNILSSLDVSGLNLSYLSTINNPNLQTICVNTDQLSNVIQNWNKDGSADYSANCNTTTSTEKITGLKSLIFPNPASESIQFSNNLVSIINTEGKLVFHNNKDISSIDVSYWSKGIYFAQFSNGQVIKTVIK
jgi:hypothetical protein|tara:strand:+ start:522 stop:2132 length:1611 start_codon:yes stop_codon:yes gene_type:complete